MTQTLDDLNDRARTIFKLVVDGYLSTGDPVGSRTISRVNGIDLSPATVRNVMADLEDAGLLQAPHTSAGRIPTDLGLRFFVDGMMQISSLLDQERAILDAERLRHLSALKEGASPEAMGDITRALSGLSDCASMVFVPKKDVTVKHLEFVPLNPTQAMVILVGDDGRVENRLIDVPPGTPQASLVQAGNFLNARLAGRSFETVAEDLMAQAKRDETELDEIANRLVELGLASWGGGQTGGADKTGSLIITGQSKLLDTVEHQGDVKRLQELFDALEQKRGVMQLMDLARSGRGVSLFIGAENKYFSMSGSSLIAAPYMDGSDRVVGVIGVIGPTRLNYAKIIPLVDYTAQMVTDLMRHK